MCSATYNEAQLGVVFEQRRVGLFACVADRLLQRRKEKGEMVAGVVRMRLSVAPY